MHVYIHKDTKNTNLAAAVRIDFIEASPIFCLEFFKHVGLVMLAAVAPDDMILALIILLIIDGGGRDSGARSAVISVTR